MTITLWIGIGLIALFIIGKIMMSVGKIFLWILLLAGIAILASPEPSTWVGSRHERS